MYQQWAPLSIIKRSANSVQYRQSRPCITAITHRVVGYICVTGFQKRKLKSHLFQQRPTSSAVAFVWISRSLDSRHTCLLVSRLSRDMVLLSWFWLSLDFVCLVLVVSSVSMSHHVSWLCLDCASVKCLFCVERLPFLAESSPLGPFTRCLHT